MLLQGTVINGQVVLDSVLKLPEGTRVTVEVNADSQAAPEADKPTLGWLLELAGSANELPEDMASNHDHYLHGASKR